jgi:hypothetical protein
METKRYEFVLEASQPIAHHSETLGNQSILMREDIRQPGGGFAKVPIVTGDTMRGNVCPPLPPYTRVFNHIHYGM